MESRAGEAKKRREEEEVKDFATFLEPVHRGYSRMEETLSPSLSTHSLIHSLFQHSCGLNLAFPNSTQLFSCWIISFSSYVYSWPRFWKRDKKPSAELASRAVRAPSHAACTTTQVTRTHVNTWESSQGAGPWEHKNTHLPVWFCITIKLRYFVSETPKTLSNCDWAGSLPLLFLFVRERFFF